MQPSQLSCYELTRASRDRGLEKLQRPGNWYCPVGFLACWLHSLEPRQPTRILEVTNFGNDLILFPTSVNMLLFASVPFSTFLASQATVMPGAVLMSNSLWKSLAACPQPS